MDRTSNVSDLQKRLRAKIESDRVTITTLTQEELEKLSDDLKQLVQDELATIKNDIKLLSDPLKKTLVECQGQAENLKRRLLRGWGKSFLIGLSLFLGISAGSWGMTQYFLSKVQSSLEVKDLLELEILEQQQALNKIEAKTWGVIFNENKNGQFLVLPKGMTVQTGWTVGEREAVKLSEK